MGTITSGITRWELMGICESHSPLFSRGEEEGEMLIRDASVSFWIRCSDEEEGKTIKLVCSFSDERWTKGRSVTAVDWSPKVRLFL